MKGVVATVREDLRRYPVPPAAKHDFWSRRADEWTERLGFGRRGAEGGPAIRPRILATAISRLDHHAHVSSRLVVGQVGELDEAAADPGAGPGRLEEKVDRVLAVLDRLDGLQANIVSGKG